MLSENPWSTWDKHVQDFYEEIYNISWKDIEEDEEVKEIILMRGKPDMINMVILAK